MLSNRREKKRTHDNSGGSTSEASSTGSQSIGRSSRDADNSVGARPGRPSLRLSLPLRRCLARLYITTDEPLSHIEDAIAKAGGPKKLWVRQQLREITGLDKDSGLSLDNLRMKDRDAIQKRESEQREAMRIDKSRTKESTAIPAQDDLNASMQQAASQIDPQVAADPSASRSAISSSSSLIPPPGSGQPGFNLSASRRIPTFSGSSIRNANDSTLHSGLPQTISLIHPATSQALMAPNVRPHNGTRPITRNRRRASTISVSSVTRCLISKKRSVCSFVAKRCSISVLSIQSRTSSSLSLSRLRRPSTYQQFYAQPVDREGDTAVELLLAARNHKHSDIDTRDKLSARLNQLPDDSECRRYVKAADHNQVTALHLAVAYGYPAVCCLLLDSGADHKARTVQGETPYSFAKSAQNAAGQEYGLHRYSHIVLCRDRVKYGVNPPIPTLRGGESGERRTKRRKTSKKADFSHESHVPHGSNSSAPHGRTQTHGLALSDEDLEWTIGVGTNLGQHVPSVPSRAPMTNPTANLTQESLHLGQPFTDSPLSASFPVHPLHRVSTLDFAAMPSCTTSARRPVPTMPVRRHAVHPSYANTSFQEPMFPQFPAPPTFSAMFNESCSGQDPSDFPTTVETKLSDERESMPEVFPGGVEILEDQPNYAFAAQASHLPLPQQQASYQDDNTLIDPQDLMKGPFDPSDQPHTIDQPSTFERPSAFGQPRVSDQPDPFYQQPDFETSTGFDPLDVHFNFDAAWPPNSAPPTDSHLQQMPTPFQPSFQNENNTAPDDELPWLPLTPKPASHGMQTTGTRTIWYDCPHNNPTSAGRSWCPFGCTPIQAIYGLGCPAGS